MVAAYKNRQCPTSKNGLNSFCHFSAIVLVIVISNIDVSTIGHTHTLQKALALVDVPVSTGGLSAPSGVTDGVAAYLTRAEPGPRTETDTAVIWNTEECNVGINAGEILTDWRPEKRC